MARTAGPAEGRAVDRQQRKRRGDGGADLVCSLVAHGNHADVAGSMMVTVHLLVVVHSRWISRDVDVVVLAHVVGSMRHPGERRRDPTRLWIGVPVQGSMDACLGPRQSLQTDDDGERDQQCAPQAHQVTIADGAKHRRGHSRPGPSC